jgi:hypothetical protein
MENLILRKVLLIKSWLTGFFFICLSSPLFAQIIVDNPRIGQSTANSVAITQVELTDTSTALPFHVSGRAGVNIFIPSLSYIVPVGTTGPLFVKSDDGLKTLPASEGGRLYLTRAEGITLDNNFLVPLNGNLNYILYFPALPKGVQKIDFGEANEGGNWFFYDIELQNGRPKSRIPRKFVGSWFPNDGSRKLFLALYDTLSVYNFQVWNYGEVSQSGNHCRIELWDQFDRQNIIVEYLNSESIRFSLPGKAARSLFRKPQMATPDSEIEE